MYETMRLCVGCKACRRECPTGVDMNRMKTEFLFHYHRKNGLSIREKLFAYLPRYAPLVSRFGGLANLRDLIPGVPWITDKLLGLTSRRELPRWDSKPFSPDEVAREVAGPEVVLLADTFSTKGDCSCIRQFQPKTLLRAHISFFRID